MKQALCPRNLRPLFALALAAKLLVLMLPLDASARELPSQRQVEAVYIFKFASFVTWPETSFDSPSSAIIVGILDDPKLATELDRVVHGKQVRGRPLQVRSILDGEDLQGLHVLFVGAAAKARAAPLLGALEGRPVLTVSNEPTVHARGTMVNFVVADQRVRFDVAEAPLRRSQLRMSALMMTAAREVARAGR